MSAMVVFTCPKSGQEVRSEIFTDEQSFLAIGAQEIEMRCPECGEKHRWWMAEGQLRFQAKIVRWPVPARIP